MKYILPLIALALFAFGGCASTVDRSAVDAQLTKLEAQATALHDFIATQKPIIDQLTTLATSTGNPQYAATAASIAANVAKAQAALPAVEATIADTKKAVDGMQADAAGKVPWWSVAGGVLLAVLPRVAGALVPPLAPLAEGVANLAWSAMATKRQKDDEAVTAAGKAA